MVLALAATPAACTEDEGGTTATTGSGAQAGTATGANGGGGMGGTGGAGGTAGSGGNGGMGTAGSGGGQPAPCGAPQVPGTWHDPVSALCWQDPDADTVMDRSTASTYCAALALGGPEPGSWRLPTISELRSLVVGCPGTETGGACGVTDSCLNASNCSSSECSSCSNLGGPGADGCYWPSAVSGHCPSYYFGHWSSSDDTSGTTHGWGVGFENGGVYAVILTGELHVRCVRDGP